MMGHALYNEECRNSTPRRGQEMVEKSVAVRADDVEEVSASLPGEHLRVFSDTTYWWSP